MRIPWRSRPVEPTARAVRDEWLEWLRLSAFSPLTIKSYRLTTDRLLERWPELAFAEFTDEHVLGIIEESKPASRQARRSAFQNWFQWGVRTKRIERDPMRHVQTYRAAQRPPVEVFTDAECKVLCSLPEPDGTLMAVLLGTGLRKNGDDYLWYCHPGGHPRRRHDRPIVDASMHQWWVRSITAAGIPYRNLHVTRHTYATEWRRRGLAMDDVGTLLRHADFRTTQRVYVHTKLIDVRKRMEACQPR